ncbi:MAG TPA: lysophospholipase [Candidatus Hydrogenedens sp.]|nr:lysophospholipase [Candidatus Hydrogenedens sp.]
MLNEGWFNIRNEKFYRRTWLSEENKKIANIILIHGYGEHCSRYDYMSEMMNKQGINVFSYDQRGFGHSPGKRAWINDFNELLDDFDIFLNVIKEEIISLPTFFMGHSMGGMVLARYVETRPNCSAKGLIFSSPFLALNEDVPKFLLKLSGILATVLPWVPVSRVDNTALSKDLDVVKRADEDPLGYHGSVKAYTGYVFYKVIQEIQRDFKLIKLPTIILHGKKDQIVPFSGSINLFENITSEDKAIHLFENGYHELWNDYEKDEMIGKICGWVSERALKS